MRVVVTGATGNIGSALLRALEAGGHHVHGIARRPPAESPAAVCWSRLDLTEPDSIRSLRGLVDGADAVVNLAWAFQPMRRRSYLHRASVGILDRVARAVLATSDAQLVHLSSVAVYSPRRSAALVHEDWPRDGIPGSTYSQLKVEAERLLESAAWAADAQDRVSVVRPCLVGQLGASGAMLRCGALAVFPGRLLSWLPVVPVDERFGIQLVHAEDVADAVVRVLERRAAGAFNVAAPPVLRGRDVATALGGKPIHVRQELSRALVAATWHAHVSPLDPGWVDMALQAPWVDTSRATELLGWRPRHPAEAVLDELVRGMVSGSGSQTSALRPRRAVDGIRRALTQGSVAWRRLT
jgi:nucleoside-diphosphate-sugar epimerase